MDTLYAYYSRSPSNCRLVQSASATLATEIRKIGKIFDVRWLSSSYRSVDAVFKSLPGLVGHLEIVSSNNSMRRDNAKGYWSD